MNDWNEIRHRISTAVEEDPARGIHRMRRDVFTDPELFELEMKHIFEGNWLYVAHESQIPRPNDYITTTVGRQPVIISRDRDGVLHAFVNACAHRGATLCRDRKGNRAVYSCPFHGWSFGSDGRLLKVKDPEGAGYPEQFNRGGSHDLTRVPRFESYRGFLFASLNADVAPLAEHLGDAARIIDMMVDQAPEGLEVVRGSSTYVFDGNWKLQAENGADGYHVTATHWNYVATISRRKTGLSADDVKAMDVGSWNRQEGGFFAFGNGHMCLWIKWPNPQDRPVFERRAQLAERFGEARADWMIAHLRNLCLYPNVFLMDQMSSQIRVFRPLSVDKTEVTIHCIAPRGESDEARARRLRQYEDFFNASGMATPDDLEEFRACQEGYNGRLAKWSDISRGAVHWVHGADDNARLLGMEPVMCGARQEDEGLYGVHHRYWVEAMTRAVEREARGESR
ncbi:Rieske 2Fe-2S domain-containing protein [Thauera sinica]|uniref:Rieske 2Fe-2S domain-containing protein n=1 Tax=Thauera sinica TaxID=2665146 RepID=A0ABW1AQN9_9RHOO|nr:Rieske 2Fe-2S domain-containing protein [Thauera sp. K11]ATE59674.1 benzoate 1,2-dioxygenase large subunit [Thauera sp. K11]